MYLLVLMAYGVRSTDRNDYKGLFLTGGGMTSLFNYFLVLTGAGNLA